MFFIYGSPRSGTTLLAQCLSAHSQILVPGETDCFVPVSFILDRVRDEKIGKQLISDLVIQSERFAFSIGEYLAAEQVRELIDRAPYDARILSSVFDEMAISQGKKVCGDKSPNDLLFLRMLQKQGFLEGDTKIVHIVRDIRDVMCSLKRLNWVADLDKYFARNWSETNLYLSSLYADKRNYFFLRYVDFVKNPKFYMTQLCSFLGVSYESQMVDSVIRHDRYRSDAHHQKLYQPISANYVGEYRKFLSESEFSQIMSQAWEGLNYYGFDTSDSLKEGKEVA